MHIEYCGVRETVLHHLHNREQTLPQYPKLLPPPLPLICLLCLSLEIFKVAVDPFSMLAEAEVGLGQIIGGAAIIIRWSHIQLYPGERLPVILLLMAPVHNYPL
jgi:hypothetical protein